MKSSAKDEKAICPSCGSSNCERQVAKFRVGGRGDLRETTFHGCHDHAMLDGGEGHLHDHGHDHGHDHHDHSDHSHDHSSHEHSDPGPTNESQNSGTNSGSEN